jgi:hypothetical protein
MVREPDKLLEDSLQALHDFFLDRIGVHFAGRAAGSQIGGRAPILD